MNRPPSSTLAQRFVWCLYDFGNSAFPTVIITAAYAIYFRDVVVEGTAPGRGDQLWGITTATGAALVFVTAPLLGTVADRWSFKRELLWVHAWLCVTATAFLVLTGPGTIGLAIGLVIVALYAFEGANVFYNAYLPELVPRAEMPRLSGRAWAFGYAGGLLCLALVLVLLRIGGLAPYLVPAVVAGWFFVFTLPTLLGLPEDRGARDRCGAGIWERLGQVRQHPPLLRFLVALFFYMNGLNTVYVFAAIFASQSLGFTQTESIVLVMVLNLVAAPGALLFGRIAERTDAKRSIAISLWLWLLVIVGATIAAWPELLDLGPRRLLFWGVAAVASLCIGATQATSRTFVGQLAPAGMSGQFFGFMAFAGRASAILGPLVFGQVSLLFGGDQRFAVASIAIFFVLGLILLGRVQAPDVDR